MTVGISQHLDQQHGIKIAPGRKGMCPFCRKNTFSIRKDDTIGKCFHPACGRAVTVGSLSSDYTGSLFEVLDRIKDAFHKYLLAQAEKNYRGAYQYMVQDRQIDPRIIRDSDLGAVPPGFDAEAVFKDSLEAIDKQEKEFAAKLEESFARRLSAKEARDKDHKDGKQKTKPTAKDKTEQEKRWELTLLRLQEARTFLQEQRDELKTKFGNTADWVVFFHTDALHRVRSLRFRRPFAKDFQSHCPFANSWGKSIYGLFNHGLFTPYKSEAKRSQNKLIVVEGEFNQLQLQSLAVRASKEEGEFGHGTYMNWVAATGSADTVDLETIRRLLQVPEAVPIPIICYDNDDAGLTQATMINYALTCELCTTPTPGTDIDDFIRSFGDDYQSALASVSDLLKAARLSHRPFEALAKHIFWIRQKHGEEDERRTFEINADVAACVVKDFRERGRFYHDGQRAFYFLDGEKKLIALDDHDRELTLLLAKYGLNAAEDIHEYVGEALYVEALSNGTATRVYRFTRYDQDTFTLYIFNHACGIYRVTVDSLELVDNGADGVLFLHDGKNEPFTLVAEENLGDLFYETVTAKINLVEHFHLTVAEQRAIFNLWFLCMFFRELLPTKPLQCFIGPKGSGKSHTLRKVGMLLFGSKFEVKNLPAKEDDFDAITTNSHFAGFDNADSRVAWLPDRLAICATGGTVSKRVLYTTNTLVDYPIECFVGITSRTPHFRRDDVADRMLINHVRRFEEGEFISEQVLLNDVLGEHRNRVMTAVIRQLQDVISALQATAGRTYRTSFRMADFGTFALRLADANGTGDAMEEIFTRMSEEQAAFTLEGDSFIELLNKWLECQANHGRQIDATTLHKELVELAKQNELEFTYKSGRSLGQRICNAEHNLRSVVQLEISSDPHRKLKLYRFWTL